MPSDAPKPPERILLIDERRGFVEEVEEHMAGSGIELVVVDSLDSTATRELLHQGWMCVLVDLDIPPHTGVSAILEARQFTTNSLIALTSEDRADYEINAIIAGADDYLLKHWINRDRLLRAIRIAHARHQRRLSENEGTQLIQAQMVVLQELATLMAEIRDWLRPKPLLRNFFRRMSTDKGRAEIAGRLKAGAYAIGKVIVQVIAIVAALLAALNETGTTP